MLMIIDDLTLFTEIQSSGLFIIYLISVHL